MQIKRSKPTSYEIMKMYVFSSSSSYFLQGMWANGKGDGLGRKRSLNLFDESIQRPCHFFPPTSNIKSQTRLFTISPCLPQRFCPLNVKTHFRNIKDFMNLEPRSSFLAKNLENGNYRSKNFCFNHLGE